MTSTDTLPAPARTEADLRAAFMDQIGTFPDGYRIRNCIQCGSCTASCPVARAMDLTPRQLVALFRAGFLEEVLRSRTIWLCASCYACTVRCPAGIRVTDNIYALKRLAKQKEIFPRRFPAYVLSAAFASNIHRYGRNWELWLAIRYFLTAAPRKLLSGHLMRTGIAMARKGRMGLRPRKIRGIEEIRAIVAKAEAIGGL